MPHHEAPGHGDVVFRSTLVGDGSLSPIEERAGRRLLRVVDPTSEEGWRLLRSGEVVFVGPDGESFGKMGVEEAWRRLTDRLEALLADASADAEGIREGLERLRGREHPTAAESEPIPPLREGRA